MPHARGVAPAEHDPPATRRLDAANDENGRAPRIAADDCVAGRKSRLCRELDTLRQQPGLGIAPERCHLDEVFIRIRGKLHYLWRAIDQHGTVLDILVQSRRNAKAAKRFFKKLLKGLQYVPRVIVTDKLKSYGAAMRKILPGVEHRQSRYLNNRAEVSHQPTRRRERQMRRFKSARHAQRFLCSHGQIHNLFQLRRHRLTANDIGRP